jgi:aryl-alcohol dehydrogenase-like predicted oxidoreductase
MMGSGRKQMEYRQLGRSGLRVSLHTLGTMTFGGLGLFAKAGNTGVADARRLIDVSVDHGVNFIDTSNIYSTGKSEEIIGEVIQGKSSQLLVGTKVRFGMGKGPNEGGLSRFHIIEECHNSLKRLRRDHIDVYYLHEWDGQTPMEEQVEALDTLVKQGKVRYVACSNFSAWQTMKGLMVSERYGYQRFIAQQIHYTLEAREAEYELIPLALDQGVGLVVWSPLAGGLLSGKFRKGTTPEQSRQLNDWGEPPIRDQARLYRIIEVLVKIAEARGVSAAQIALAWLAGRPAVASIVIGARNETQLVDNLASADLTLTDQERKKLDDVSLMPLIYPYWHQASAAAERLGPADLSLMKPHLAKMTPRM